RLQLLLELWSEDAGLDQCTARGAVDLHHPVQVSKVDADRPGVAVADVRLDTTHDRRATAEGDRGGALIGAPGENVLDVAPIARVGDHIGRVAVVAADASDQVLEGLAQRMDRALALVL